MSLRSFSNLSVKPFFISRTSAERGRTTYLNSWEPLNNLTALPSYLSMEPFSCVVVSGMGVANYVHWGMPSQQGEQTGSDNR